MADDCVFCGILAGTVPADIVHEGTHTLAFRDTTPVAPVHVLVIPRHHVISAATVEEADAEVVGEMFVTARLVAEQEGVVASGYRLVFNVGRDARNTVPHLHLHLLGGRPLEWPPG